MILICDNDCSPRARNLQRLFLDLGYPASVCSIDKIKEHLPVWFFITFSDSFDNLRRTPYDKIFALVIGDGFVNTALNAIKVPSVDEALIHATIILKDKQGISRKDEFPFGVMCRSVFFCDYFVEISGHIVPLTDIELLIFKYIFACSVDYIFATADMIEKFCYPPKDDCDRENVIPVHISNINKKSMEILGRKIIGSMRHHGYYIEKQ